MKKQIFACLAAQLIFHFAALTQSSTSKDAFNAFKNKDWTHAEENFIIYLQTKPDDTLAMYYLGMSQLKQQKYTAAIESFRNVYELELSPDFKNELSFEMAKSYIGMNNKLKCLQLLSAAASNGATYEGRLNDSLFSSLQTSSDFINIREQFKHNATPCLYDERYKRLDFFVGIWDVYIGNNYVDKVATDTVTKFFGGCSVDEKFKWLGSDYVGESISFYDDAAQKFRMCWAGKSGDIRNFEELSSKENYIQFLAVTTSDSKKDLIHRRMTITYNPANQTLHEYIENSFDLGKTWQPDFDALFKKVN